MQNIAAIFCMFFYINQLITDDSWSSILFLSFKAGVYNQSHDNISSAFQVTHSVNVIDGFVASLSVDTHNEDGSSYRKNPVKSWK